MYSKIEITGTLELVTGMHIGASSAFAAIGAVDSPVIRDTLTDLPLIPGSSLKGKLRSLLAKQYNTKTSASFNDDASEILRLFGNSVRSQSHPSRLIFSDMILSNIDEIRNNGVRSATEVKFENTINRLTAVANPRQIERTIRGAKFPISVIYNAEDADEIVPDITLLSQAFTMLQYDYLGGHGSRGYGRVLLTDLSARVVVGTVDESILQECQSVLKDV